MTLRPHAKKLKPVYLKSVYLKNFRNYQDAEVHLSPNLNVFYGDNAQGKTNILEAIYLIATGRSFRTQRLNEIIRSGESFFFLEAEIVKDGVTQIVKISFDGQNRKLQLDANHYSTFHPLLGLLPAVLYTPYDIELISGSPTERRRFLNMHLVQSDPLYVHHLTRFWRAMKQRNCLLRAKASESLDCWENEMAHSAEYITKSRREMVDELQKPLLIQSKKLSGDKESHELNFHISQGKEYLKQLQKSRVREMELGLTLIGPHRDDLSLLIDGKPARLFASEGQKKTAIAALRMAEWQRLCKRITGPALMGIDDLGLHLDESRQKLLRSSLDELGQVFITTPHIFLNEGRHIQIQNGSIIS
ncbi:MAG: DNA replication and repair protein RecF [Chlamydiae bacterium CG10_big_fil_rev_8_21_14_0_10_42_34]|nr:MAG: DNA replication and repair protein RecF [Chlamydiae bacterium CG10_big_fil_rev_8_21_14_0_10_42_34]